MNRTDSRQDRSRPRLRLIRGGLDTVPPGAERDARGAPEGGAPGMARISHVEVAGTTVAVTPLDAPIPPLDAVVVEDDTWGVLGADLELDEESGGLDDALENLAGFDPHTPGSVLLREGQPLELRAVVHDLDRNPTLQETWVTTALTRVFQVAEDRALDTMAMPLLGTVHGRLEGERAVALLVEALEGSRHGRPRRLWLAVHRQDVRETLALLNASVRG